MRMSCWPIAWAARANQLWEKWEGGDVFRCVQWRCCPSEGVSKGGEATVCKMMEGVLIIVEYMVGCLHQEDVTHIAYRWETCSDAVMRHEE